MGTSVKVTWTIRQLSFLNPCWIGGNKCQGQILPLSDKELGFPGGSVVKNLPVNAGDAGDEGWISGSGRFLRFLKEGNCNSLQYFCLENNMDRGAW